MFRDIAAIFGHFAWNYKVGRPLGAAGGNLLRSAATNGSCRAPLTHPTVRYLLSIGSNLGKKAENLEVAIAALHTLPHTLIEVSSFLRTAAMYRTDQPEFLNGAVLLDSKLEPEEMLLRLQAIEEFVGRERAEKYGPRLIDIDIVAADDLVIESETLRVPHPLMHERRFVLEPLIELAPDWKHPTRGATVREMLEQLSDDA